MTAPMQTATRIHYAPDTVVTLRTDPIRGSVADGDLPPSRALGPGFVCEPEIFGKTHVHWIEPDVDTWMNAAMPARSTSFPSRRPTRVAKT